MSQIIIEETVINSPITIEETIITTVITIEPMAMPSTGEGGSTNLAYIPTPINGTVTSDTGTDATIPLATSTNAGLLKPNKFTLLESITEAFTTGLKSLYDTTATNLTELLATGSRLITGAEITRVANALLTTDIYAWAKEATKPSYTKTEIGLGNVDNTADMDKPISSSATTALGLKVDKVTGERLINASEITKLANTSGANTGDQIIPTSLPASDVYAWAKEAVKPTYTNIEVGAPSGSGTSTGTNTGDQDLSGLATKESPTFTGTPSVPTAAPGTNTTQAASTAFVLANAGASVDTSDFALSEGTILHYPVAATTAGTFSNVGNVCTGIGTAITSQMIGAKVTKANGEVGIIATVTNSTSFTATGFTTNSTNTAFSVKVIAVKVGTTGVTLYDSNEGYQRLYLRNDGEVQMNNSNFQPNGNVTINGSVLGVQGNVEMTGSGAINARTHKYKLLYTTATLPVLGASERATAWVTDALSPTYRGILVGGGTVGCMVTWDGTNWRT